MAYGLNKTGEDGTRKANDKIYLNTNYGYSIAKKWYASIYNDGEISVDDLVKQIEKFSALSEADIKGVIIAL